MPKKSLTEAEHKATQSKLGEEARKKAPGSTVVLAKETTEDGKTVKATTVKFEYSNKQPPKR